MFGKFVTSSKCNDTHELDPDTLQDFINPTSLTWISRINVVAQINEKQPRLFGVPHRNARRSVPCAFATGKQDLRRIWEMFEKSRCACGQEIDHQRHPSADYPSFGYRWQGVINHA